MLPASTGHEPLDYKDVGIPAGFSLSKLLVDTVGGFVVAHFTRLAKPNHGAFWVRGFNEERYRPLVGEVTGERNHSEAALDPAGFRLFVNVWSLGRVEGANGESWEGYDWLGLESYDLTTATKQSTLTQIIVEGAGDGVWVSDLLGPSTLVGHVVAKVAVQHQVGDRGHVTYHICDLDTATGVARVLTDLRAVFA